MGRGKGGNKSGADENRGKTLECDNKIFVANVLISREEGQRCEKGIKRNIWESLGFGIPLQLLEIIVLAHLDEMKTSECYSSLESYESVLSNSAIFRHVSVSSTYPCQSVRP